MTNYDIAIGLDHAVLEKAVAHLYADNVLRQSIFQGTETKELAPLGSITLTYDILAAPTFVLTAPTTTQWDAAIKSTGVTERPTQNAFQLKFGDIKGTVQVGSAAPMSAQGWLTVFAVVEIVETQASLTPLAIEVDESKFTVWDKLIINQMLVPTALNEISTNILKSIQLPPLPELLGVVFNPPIAAIEKERLLLATTMNSNTAAPDLSGESWPGDKPFFLLASTGLINAALGTATGTLKGMKKSGQEEKGDNILGKAEASYTVAIKDISVTVDSSDPTIGIARIDVDVNVSASVSGILPAVACPIGAALGAL